jgi:sulfur-oxidizing protein SoxB
VNLTRREFLGLIAAGAAAGLPLDSRAALDLSAGSSFYDSVERFGNLSLLHFTDCHAQLKPVYFREPSVNLGIGAAAGKAPHLVGEALLARYGMRAGTREAHAFTFLDFARAAKAHRPETFHDAGLIRINTRDLQIFNGHLMLLRCRVRRRRP